MTWAIDTPSRVHLILRTRSITSLTYTFFFISGVPALIYQLIWQRVLFRIFGTSMDSVTVVVTAFMLGLGIGSLFGSWLSVRQTRPLLVVAAMELSIGVFGICSIWLFNNIDPLVQSLSLPARAAVVAGLIFVPTLLMGATLPVLVGHLVRRSANVGLSVGGLYRVNALGAVIGCTTSALILFPFLGLQASAYIAATLNVAVAAVAVMVQYLDRGLTEIEPVPAAAHRQAQRMPLPYPFAAALVFSSGFVSLSFEIYLLHLTSFASGTSSIAFSLTLGAFLLGIASGAQAVGDWCKEHGSHTPPSGGLVRLLLMHAPIGLLMLPVIAVSGPLNKGVLGIIAISAFLIARSLSGTFSLCAYRAIEPSSHAGRSVGILYLFNIAGSATGCLITGFILSDFMGARSLAILLSGAGLIVTLAFVWQWTGWSKATAASIWAIAAVSLLLALFQKPLADGAIEVMQFKRDAAKLPPLARVVENRNGIITVDRAGAVYGGGVYDGRFSVDLVHDTNGIIRAYALSLFHPAPRDVFMVGLASGSWAQVIANNPNVKHLTVVEINPGYLALIREQPEVRSVLENPKVEIIIDDAHRWLKRNPGRMFDAVIANATFHYRSNASNLLSVEFDGLVSEHLKKGGIYLFNTTDSQRALKTACISFPHGYRLFNNALVGNQPIIFDARRWEAVLRDYRIDGRPVLNLSRQLDRDSLANLLRLPPYANQPGGPLSPIESCSHISARLENVTPITDDNMGTEWRYPLGFE